MLFVKGAEIAWRGEAHRIRYLGHRKTCRKKQSCAPYSQIVKNEVVVANISNVTTFIGDEIKEEAFYPDGLKTEAENINIAGEIVYLQNKQFKSKRKNAEGNEIEKDYFTFEIKHKNARIKAVYFPRIADVEKAKLKQIMKS